MNEVKGIAKVNSIERRKRNGKNFIVVNGSAWYAADKYTVKTAAEDYIKTHSNGGWGFMPRILCTVTVK